MWLSLVGAILCVATMFLISWSTALLTFAAVMALYMIVAYGKPGKFFHSRFAQHNISNPSTLSSIFFRCQLGLLDTSTDLQKCPAFRFAAKQRRWAREKLPATTSRSFQHSQFATNSRPFRQSANQKPIPSRLWPCDQGCHIATSSQFSKSSGSWLVQEA